MTTRDWLKALDASCAESFFYRTPDGHLVGREIDDWDGIGLEVDLGQDDWLDDDEVEGAESEYSSSEDYEDDDVNPDEVPANWEAGWDQQPLAVAAADEPGRRQRRRAAANGAGAAAANGNGEPVAVKHLLAHEVTYVSDVPWEAHEGGSAVVLCLVWHAMASLL